MDGITSRQDLSTEELIAVLTTQNDKLKIELVDKHNDYQDEIEFLHAEISAAREEVATIKPRSDRFQKALKQIKDKYSNHVRKARVYKSQTITDKENMTTVQKNLQNEITELKHELSASKKSLEKATEYYETFIELNHEISRLKEEKDKAEKTIQQMRDMLLGESS
ncbi:hypothetical protein M426DRAFT_18447 [Hypoxylon sp. CI-4A]|nr:hypothetical protein M426DRAFT_18447 [Hypoxylon sp. CI-4A]